MADDFWSRVRAAFEAANEVPPEARAAVVAALSDGDASVERAARELLDAQQEEFLSTPAVIPAGLAHLGERLVPGSLIGNYRVVRLVGRGGMGEVYEGVRATADFEQRVAIKLLRAGLTTPEALSRFQRERRILARLSHPNIATLHDGGVTPDGIPFLVMEYVEGERITTWCDQRRLPVAERLTLFRQVCDAVAFAHRNLVVHRDLKPGNILVTAGGTVKLLDFGIAKVLAEGPDTGEAETRPESKVVTREYAAPEHLADGPVTTGTDVYALGLLLFELLAGQRPFAASEALPFVDFVRVVTTTDPPAPSQVRPDGARGVPDRSRLRGDLDAIVLRALRASPAERYRTVDALVADLRRFEEGRPVSAMQGQRLYRVRKFARRNRAALLAGAVIVALIVAGVVTVVIEAGRISVERNQATAANAFLTQMLQSVDPTAQGRDVLMADVLDSAAKRISRNPPREPEVEASLQSAIGASYMALGNYAAAEPHLRRVLLLRQQQPGDRTALAAAMQAMGGLYDSRGEYPRADTVYRQALAELPSGNDTATARRRADLVNQLARMQSQQGNYAAAVTLLEQAISLRSALYGQKSVETARTMSDLGLTLLQQGNLPRAESVQVAAIAITRKVSPLNRPLEGDAVGRLATVLELSGDRPGADSAYQQSLNILEATLGADHPDVTWIRYNYAGALLSWGDAARALALADQIIALRGRTIPDTHPMLASTLIIKGQALGKLGRHAEAIEAMREGLALRVRFLAPDHWLIGSARSILGDELWTAGQRKEGLDLMTTGCRAMRKALGPDQPKVKDAEARLVRADKSAARCQGPAPAGAR